MDDNIKENQSLKGHRKKSIDIVLNPWLKLQKIIKEEITLNEIISKQQETNRKELYDNYIKYYENKLKTRETLENLMNIENNRPLISFELVESPEKLLSDTIDPIHNLFLLMRGNVEFILKLVSILDDKKIGNNSEIDSIVELFSHQFYENLLIPDPEQEDLLLFIYLLMEKEISNMNSASVSCFIDENSTFLGKFLKSYTKNQELKTYLSMTLGHLILSIENSSDSCLDLNPNRIQAFFQKKGEDILPDLNCENFCFNSFLTKNICKSTIKINKMLYNDEEDGEEEEEDDDEEMTDSKDQEDTKDNKEENSGEEYKKTNKNLHLLGIAFNENYTIDIDQDFLNDKIQKETDSDLKEFYLRQLERISKDPETFTNKKFIYSLEDLTCRKMEILFKYKSNFVKIKGYIDIIIQSLIDKITTIPYTLRCICKVIHILIKEKFPRINTYERNAFIGEFIFGKCILPILIHSDFNVVVTTTILSQNTRQCLKIIAKVLTKINRGLFFEANIDTDYTIFNHYIIEVIPLINRFYTELINVELPKRINERIDKFIEKKGKNKKNMFEDMNKKQKDLIRKNQSMMSLDHKKLLQEELEAKKPRIQQPVDINLHCCVCYSIDDLMILIKILKPELNEFSSLPDGAFFAKTIEKISNQEFNLIKAKNNSSTRKFFLYLKDRKQIITEDLEEAKKSYTLLECGNSELLLQRIKFCIKKVLTGVNLINNKDYSYFNNAKTNGKFLIALKNTIQDLEEFNENELMNAIPLRWYSQYISNNKKMLPKEYKENDYDKLLYELLEEEEKTLLALKENSSIIITSNGMNIRFAEKMIEKAKRDLYRIRKIERFMKMEKFINKSIIEVIIKKEEQEPISSSFFGSLINRIGYQNQKEEEEKPVISVIPLIKVLNKHGQLIDSKDGKNKYKTEKGEYYAKNVKEFIAKFSEYNEVNLDISEGYPKNKVYLTFETYLEILRTKMKQDELFAKDNDCEIRIILESISDHMMKKMYNDVFPKSQLDIDLEFYRKTKSLYNITPEHLEIKSIYVNELKYATDCVRQIDKGKSAYEKLNYIAMAHQSINNTVKFSSGKNEEAGADELSPIFQYIIIKATPMCFYSNIFYIKAFLSPSLLDGRNGYHLAQMESAAEFILKLNIKTLETIKTDFEKKIMDDGVKKN